MLDGLEVRWMVAGGLAARAHGAGRELNDIDLYVEEGALERILPEVDRRDLEELAQIG